MSTSTTGGLEPYADEFYPSALLKYLLKQMMVQFTAQGACIALCDESTGGLMKTYMHVRLRGTHTATSSLRIGSGGIRVPKRHNPVHLENDTSPSLPAVGRTTQPLEELDEITPQQSELFPVGAAVPLGEDIIGRSWLKNESYIMSHEEYLDAFHKGRLQPIRTDVIPDSYLVVPIQETTPFDGIERKYSSSVLGVIVLYRTTSGIGSGFQQKQRTEALQYTERITLYLQNYRLQRSQQHTSGYLQHLQEISTAFPTSLKLSDLVENIYQFVAHMVNVSSMLFTVYDRDTEKIYDVFAIHNGVRVKNLAEQPIIKLKSDCPVWWQTVQTEMRTLQFSPIQEPARALEYKELLTGTWGDQRQARSFLLLPMKMFNRATGSLCLTTTHPKAYHQEEILVLETMMQIVAVSTENAKLYEQDRLLRQEAKQREAEVAGIISKLQDISSVLNVAELLNKLVEEAAKLARADLCVFFQPSSTKEELIAHAIYSPTTFSMADDGSALPALMPPRNQEEHDKLIKMIHLQVKGTSLEQSMNELYFILDQPKLEEIAQASAEGGAIFLRETYIKQMLMIPMFNQAELIGVLAIPTPGEGRQLQSEGCCYASRDLCSGNKRHSECAAL